MKYSVFLWCALLTTLYAKSPVCIKMRATKIQNHHASSEPFISGDTFRSWCDHVLDDSNTTLCPKAIQQGDTIFVRNDLLEPFFERVHPLIKHPYILVTGNKALSAPGPFKKYLDDPMLYAWFGRHPDRQHPKFLPLPLGIANNYYPHGNTQILKEVIQATHAPHFVKTIRCYINFAVDTNAEKRNHAFEYFSQQPFCTVVTRKPYREYLTDLAQSDFVICPEGFAPDTHRLWETLLVGSYPILIHSHLDPLLTNLPVVLVSSWEEVTEEFLTREYQRLKAKTWDLACLYAPYWKKRLQAVQQKARANR